MSVKHLEFLSLKGGCIDSKESIHVKLPHCWKSNVAAHLYNYVTLKDNNIALIT